jgi:hypothetical protein
MNLLPSNELVSLRERMASLMLETYCAVRRVNRETHDILACERETQRLLALWLKECA